VGGSALDRHRETPSPLARGLELPARPEGRLEDERPVGDARKPPNARPRLLTPDLLVGVDEDDGRDGGFEAELMERAQGEHDLHQPGLHVEGTGSAEPAVLHLHLPLLQRPDGPDGIAVPDQ
jgi:hypothetical protein